MEYWFLLFCYISGSIPFGLLIGFMAGKDVRKEGSLNIGFTNVNRVCGKKWGIPVLILDIAKGFLPVFYLPVVMMEKTQQIVPEAFGAIKDIPAPEITLLGEDYYWLVAFGAILTVLGHNFPVWLKFKGGKGVATGTGALLALMPWSIFFGFIVFMVLVLKYRYISLGSIFGSASIFVSRIILLGGKTFDEKNLPASVIVSLIVVLVIIKHIPNIKRLLNGTESKIGAKKEADVGLSENNIEVKG